MQLRYAAREKLKTFRPAGRTSALDNQSLAGLLAPTKEQSLADRVAVAFLRIVSITACAAFWIWLADLLV